MGVGWVFVTSDPNLKVLNESPWRLSNNYQYFLVLNVCVWSNLSLNVSCFRIRKDSTERYIAPEQNLRHEDGTEEVCNLQSGHFHCIIVRPDLWFCLANCSVSIIIWTQTESFPVHLKYFCISALKILQSDTFSANFQRPLSFLRNGANVCDTYSPLNATADDIILFGHYVNLYPLYLLSWATIIWNDFLNWFYKALV